MVNKIYTVLPEFATNKSFNELSHLKKQSQAALLFPQFFITVDPNWSFRKKFVAIISALEIEIGVSWFLNVIFKAWLLSPLFMSSNGV